MPDVHDLDPQTLLEADKLAPVLTQLKVQTANELFEAIGYGKISTRQVLARLVPGQPFREKVPDTDSPAAATAPPDEGTQGTPGDRVVRVRADLGLANLRNPSLRRAVHVVHGGPDRRPAHARDDQDVSFEAVYQLLPIGMLGFGINLVTGMLFFIGVPGQYAHNGTFFFKIVFVLLGGLYVLYFTVDDEPWAVKAGDDAPLTAKIAAVRNLRLGGGAVLRPHAAVHRQRLLERSGRRHMQPPTAHAISDAQVF